VLRLILLEMYREVRDSGCVYDRLDVLRTTLEALTIIEFVEHGML
jgi:regulator of sirC expression with transglutaminase-like and TPR domain